MGILTPLVTVCHCLKVSILLPWCTYKTRLLSCFCTGEVPPLQIRVGTAKSPDPTANELCIDTSKLADHVWTTSSTVTFLCSTPLLGNYLVILSTSQLTLCEVEIFDGYPVGE